MTEQELKDLSNEGISYFCSSDGGLINSFIDVCRTIDDKNMRLKRDYVLPTMLIEFRKNEKLIEKIIVDRRTSIIKYQENVFLSQLFERWIKNNIPPATWPKGLQKNNCK